MDEALAPDAQQYLADPEFQQFMAKRTPAAQPTDTTNDEPLHPDAQKYLADPEFQKFLAQRSGGATRPKPEPAPGGFFAGLKGYAGEVAKGIGQEGADYIPGVTQNNTLKQWGQKVVDANPTPQGLAGWRDHPLDSALSLAGGMAGGIGSAAAIGGVGTAIASAAPFLAEVPPAAIGATVLGRGLQLAAPYIAFGAPAASSIREQQIHDDPSAATDIGKKLLATAGAGTVGAITHHVGPAGQLGMPLLTAAGRSKLGAALTADTLKGEMVKGAGMGLAQGLLTTPVEQAASLHNPFEPQNLLQTAESAISGAIGGGVIGGAMHTGNRVLRGSVNDTNTPTDLLNPSRPLQPAPPLDPNAPRGTQGELLTEPGRAPELMTPGYFDAVDPAVAQARWNELRADRTTLSQFVRERYTELPAQAAEAIGHIRTIDAELRALSGGQPMTDYASANPAQGDLFAGTPAAPSAPLADRYAAYAAQVGKAPPPVPVPEPIATQRKLPATKTTTAPSAAPGAAKPAEVALANNHSEVIKGADVPETIRNGMYTPKGAVRKNIRDILDPMMKHDNFAILSEHARLVKANAENPGKVPNAGVRIPLMESVIALRGLKPLVTDADVAKAPAVTQVTPPNIVQDALPLMAQDHSGKLTKAQNKVMSYIQEAMKDGRLDEVIDAEGVWQHQKIGEALGIDRGSVKYAITQLPKYIAKSLGVTEGELKAALKARNSTNREVGAASVDKLGLSPAEQDATAVDGGELFGNPESGAEQHMGIIDGPGGAQANVDAHPDTAPILKAVKDGTLTAADATMMLRGKPRENALAGDKEVRAAKAEAERASASAALEKAKEQKRKDDLDAARAAVEEIPKEGEFLPTLEHEFGAPLVEAASDAWDTYAHAQAADGEPTPAFEVLPEKLQKQVVKLTRTWQGMQDGAFSDLLNLFDRVEHEGRGKGAGDQASDGVTAGGSGRGSIGPPRIEAGAGSGTRTPALSRPKGDGSVHPRLGTNEPRGAATPLGEKDSRVEAAGEGSGKPVAKEKAVSELGKIATEPQVTRALDLLQELHNKDASHVNELNTLLAGDMAFAATVAEHAGYKNLSELADSIDVMTKEATEKTPITKVAPEAAAPEASTGMPNPTDEASIRATLASIAGKDSHRNITVYATAAEAIAAGTLKSTNAYGAQAWVSKGRAYFIAENIKRGQELPVFLHEVGVHLGMEKAVGPTNYAKLTDQIADWLSRGTGIEGEIAKAAHARVLKAEGLTDGGIPKGRQKDELLAYFVEEAVKRGIDPTARKYNTELGRWFATLWESFKSAIRKMGLNPDRLSSQDVVDLAYGAARMELVGDMPTDISVEHVAKVDKGQESAIAVGKEEGPQFSKLAPDLDAAKTPEQRTEADDFFTRRIDKMSPGPVKDITGATYFGIKDAVRNGLLGTAFIHDVIDHAVKVGIPMARKYSDYMEAKNRLSNVLSAPLQALASKANDLAAHELAVGGARSVNQFMSDMSYAQKWAWDTTHNGKAVKVDPALATRFKSFSPAAQEVIKDAVAFGETMRQELKKVGVDIAAGDGPYLPHKRFGDWIVISKSSEYARREALGNGSHEELKADPKHYSVSAFDGHWDARKFWKQQQAHKDFAGENLNDRVRLTKAEEYFSQIQLAPMQQIARLEAIINSENGLSKKQQEAIAGSLQTLYKQTLANVSARHAEQRRANIAGADGDMLRSLFTQGHASAALVAALAHGKEIEQALIGMRDEAATNDRDGSAKELLNEILKRHALSMLYRPTPIQNKIMALTAFQKVVTSPAFFLQQVTEPFMMLAPVLAGHFNDYGGAMREMGSAFKQSMQTIGLNPMHSGSAPDKILASLKGHKNSVGRDYDAIRELIETGRADLGNFNEFGSLGMRADKPVAHAVNTVLSKVSRVATDMEEINRIASGLTAYRMKYKQMLAGGATADAAHTDATAFATKMVDHSHGNYAAWAAPRFMMQAGSSLPIRLITQFRKFQVMELSLIGRLVHGAFQGDTPEAKAMAQRSLKYMTAQMAVVAGGLGVPLAGVASDLASLFLKDADEPWGRNTTELHLRKAIGDPTLANLLLHGAPAAAGVDVSKRIGGGGMGDLVPYAEMDAGSRKGLEDTLPKLLGPFIGGTLFGAADAYKMLRQGEYQKGMEALAPSLVTNLSKAQRFADRGVTNTKGDVLLRPEQLSAFDIASQALGLPSTHLTDRQFKQSVLMDQEAKWTELEERYTHQFLKASQDKDAEAKAAAVAGYKAVQDAKRAAGGIGTPLSTLFKARMEQIKRQVKNVGGVEVTNQTRGIMRRLEQQGV